MIEVQKMNLWTKIGVIISAISLIIVIGGGLIGFCNFKGKLDKIAKYVEKDIPHLEQKVDTLRHQRDSLQKYLDDLRKYKSLDTLIVGYSRYCTQYECYIRERVGLTREEYERGSYIYLQEFMDDSQTEICLVQIRDYFPDDDTSSADLFISKEMAGRFGIYTAPKTSLGTKKLLVGTLLE